MHRLYTALGIRPGEGATALRLLAMMLVGMAGAAVGANGVESLFFSRFGPDFLPFLYVALGPLTFAVMMGMAVPLSRTATGFLVVLPLALAAGLLVARAVLELGLEGSYPILWLVMMVAWTSQVMGSWGLAGAVSDTRQAKRLFPLYGAGLIVGGVIGGLATGPLASAIRTENLLVVWAAALVVAHLLARSVIGASVPARPIRRTGRVRPSGRMAEGFRDVWTSPFLRWMSVSLVVFAILYFTLALLFAEAATARFPRTEDLAGFLGLFMGISNGAALLTSLLVANRLFSRFGVPAMVMALAALYLAGFGALVVTGASFAALVAFRLVQMLWVNGVWATGWQALFNVVPEERRARVRSFMDGGPLQLGIVLAGGLLILSERVLAPAHLYVGGAATAALGLWSMWRARRAYRGALTDALRSGNPDVFRAEEEPFGGFREDAVARDAVAQGASDPDPALRRVSMEILADTAGPDTVPALVRALDDGDPEVRSAAVRGLARAGHPEGAPAVRRLLDDPDPGVRAQGAALLAGEPDADRVVEEMCRDPRPEWRAAGIAAVGPGGDGRERALAALSDPDASVRRAAAGALSASDPRVAVDPLVAALGDGDATVRDAAAASLAHIGSPARRALVGALSEPDLETGALAALSGTLDPPAPELQAYALRQVEQTARYHRLWLPIRAGGSDPLLLLAHAVRHRALKHAVNALRAVGSSGHPTVMALAIENLASRDRQQRANALETLETVGHGDVVRPLLAVWDDPPGRPANPAAAVAELTRDPDPWIRACAALAAGAEHELTSNLERLRGSDPDPLVREAATASLKGDPMETLSTLSVLERVVFLRKVQLFEDLPPADLKHIAEVATEHAFGDGDVIAEQGEPGDEMHIVVSGEIRVVAGHDGAARELARRTRGECIGEMAIISEQPRMASLVCVDPARTLSLDRRSFERIIRERPDTSLRVMRVLCDRLREAHADPA